MATDMKRVMLSIPSELVEGIETLKKKEFYNKSYADVYRYLFSCGLRAAKLNLEQIQTPCESQTVQTATNF